MSRLSIERQQEIDAKIDAVKLNTNLSYPENNLIEIVDAMGIKVYTYEFPEPNINGAIKYPQTVTEKPVIFINSKYSPERRTFTLAHELGHFLLHNGKDKWRIDNINYSDPENGDETEANYFAASLLMPKKELKELLNATGGEHLDAIAKYFGVSMPALENRIRWLQANK